MDSIKAQTNRIKEIRKSLRESQAIVDAERDYFQNPFITKVFKGKKVNVLKKSPYSKDIDQARKSLISLGKELETALAVLEEKKRQSSKVQNEYKENALKIFQEVSQIENKVQDGENEFYLFFPGGVATIKYPETEIFPIQRIIEQIQTDFGFPKEEVKIFGIEGKKFFEKCIGRQYVIRQNDSQETVPRFHRIR